MLAVPTDEDRSAYLHYIHAWDTPEYEHYEMVATVSEIEEILKEQLLQIVNFNYPKYKNILFYHDHANGAGELAEVEGAESFGEGREGLLRVLGCGHFFLNYFLLQCDAMHGQHAAQNQKSAILHLWRETRDAWLSGPLNRDSPCEAGVGTGEAMTDFTKLCWDYCHKEFPPEELETRLKSSGAMYTCRLLCFSDAGRDVAAEHPNEYKEFLFLHMVIARYSNRIKSKSDKLARQLCLLNRKYEAPVPDPDMEITFLPLPLKVAIATKMWARRAKNQVAARAGAQTVESTESSSEQHSSYSKSTSSYSKQQFSSRQVARGAGHTRITHASGYSTSYASEETRREWHRFVSFKSTRWTPARTGGAVKVVGQHWRLGCQGCPSAPQRRVTSSGRRRTCKWVTIKRAVVVKRAAAVRRG